MIRLCLCLLLALLLPWPLAADPPPTVQALIEGNHLQVDARVIPRQMVPGQRGRLELTVATDTWFTGGTRIIIPEVPGLVILQTEQFASNASERRGGRSWVVQRWHLDVYPQRAGTFELPPVALEIQVNAGAAGNASGRIDSPAVSFDAVVPAVLETAESWVASPDFSVRESFDRELEGLQVGDAFEREVRFEAADVLAMMLPTFNESVQPGLAAYPSPPRLDNSSNRGVARATRSVRISYVVEAEGSYRLPEQEFFWWDTGSDQLRVLTLPERDIQVGAPGSAPADSRITGQAITGALGAVAVLLLAALMLWKLSPYLGRAGAQVQALVLWLRKLGEPALPRTLNPERAQPQPRK